MLSTEKRERPAVVILDGAKSERAAVAGGPREKTDRDGRGAQGAEHGGEGAETGVRVLCCMAET